MRLDPSIALDRYLNAVTLLGHALDRGIKFQLEIRFAAQSIVQDARELGLLALHAVGMPVTSAMAPKSNSASTPCALVRYWNFGATSPCAINGSAAPSACEHVERRRMERRGARLLAQRRARLEHGDRHAVTHEIGRGHEPDRPRAGDENALLGVIDGLLIDVTYSIFGCRPS